MTDDEASRRPPQFPPPFASAWGDDEFGLWAEFSITSGDKTVTQKLRWIEPGTFWMGSPEDEPSRGRFKALRHLVTLTEGFWLADTECTQALWVAVMGSNPSRLQDDERLPVEGVSWDSVQQFLRALEAQLHDFEASLPTEAQWEYACRAGTETLFSFGDSVTPADANFGGRALRAATGEYSGRTVPVGSLPANPWGLYEMHGNVSEWCADGMREYSKERAVDPFGAITDVGRVLRGGSWLSDPEEMRSAFRRSGSPTLRPGSLGNIGFRFCSRSKKISSEGG